MIKATHPLYPSFTDPRGKTIDQYQSSHYLEMYSSLIGQRKTNENQTNCIKRIKFRNNA